MAAHLTPGMDDPVEALEELLLAVEPVFPVFEVIGR